MHFHACLSAINFGYFVYVFIFIDAETLKDPAIFESLVHSTPSWAEGSVWALLWVVFFFNWVLLEIHSSCLASTENWLFIPIGRSSYTWSSLGGNPKHGVLHRWGNLCIALICSNLQGFLRLEDPNPVIIGSSFCCSTWRDLVMPLSKCWIGACGLQL